MKSDPGARHANRLINRPQECANCVSAASGRRPIRGSANAYKQEGSECNGMVSNHGTWFVIRGSGVRAPLPAPCFSFKTHNLQASPAASDEIATSKCLLFCAHSARFQGPLAIYKLNSLPGARLTRFFNSGRIEDALPRHIPLPAIQKVTGVGVVDDTRSGGGEPLGGNLRDTGRTSGRTLTQLSLRSSADCPWEVHDGPANDAYPVKTGNASTIQLEGGVA